MILQQGVYISIPASQLLDKLLEGDWLVTEELTKKKFATGGHFSVCYLVKNQRTGQEAFMKALDFSSAVQSSDPISALKKLIDAYIFERDLLIKCKDKKLRNISTPITHGNILIPGFAEYGRVYYLIFEKAEEGDVRNFLSKPDSFELSWCFASLHSIAVGIKQLHSHLITHQDLKPSNVLIMDAQTTKIGDLGRASDPALPSDNDDLKIAGDIGYAPHDLYYGDITINRTERKFLTDIYLFGSLIFFYFTGASATKAINSKLTGDQRQNRPSQFKLFLPELQYAFAQALQDLKIETDKKAPEFSKDLIELATQLCEPDPEKRGDPKWRSTLIPNYDLQRIISRLNIMGGSIRRRK